MNQHKAEAETADELSNHGAIGLFPDRITRIDLPTRFKTIAVRNSSNAQVALTSCGNHYVVARDALGADNVLSEALYWLLAQQIGASCCRGALFFEGGHPSWASYFVQDAVHWHPKWAGHIDNCEELTKSLALDALLGIRDRHAANLLLAPSDSGMRKAIMIDNANSHAGRPEDLQSAAASELLCELPSNHAPGLPMSSLRPHMPAAVKSLTSIQPDTLQGVVQEAAHAAKEPKEDMLFKALRDRITESSGLVSQYFARLEAKR